MSDSHSLQRWETALSAARREEVAALQALARLGPAVGDTERQRLRSQLSRARERRRTAKEVISGLVGVSSMSPRETPFPGCLMC